MKIVSHWRGQARFGSTFPLMHRFTALLLLLLSAGCAHAELPALIPREVLFGNPTRAHPQISPDGSQVTWLAPDKNGVLNVWADSIPASHVQAITNESHRPIFWYTWAADGKHILYLQDNGGDEVDHLFSVDLTSGNVRDMPPFRGVRAQNILTDPQHPHFVLVALNLRDRHAFDMYRVDLETGAITLEATNPGDVLTWATDNEFVIRAATAFDGKTAESIIRVRDAVDKPWRDLVVMPFERSFQMGQAVGGSLIAGFDPDGKSLVIHSALHSDKGRLVRVDLQSGRELSVVAQDPESDVADSGDLGPAVLLNPATHAIEAVEFDYTTRHWLFLDPKVQTDFETISREAHAFLDLISRDHADRKWIVAARRGDARRRAGSRARSGRGWCSRSPRRDGPVPG